MNGPTAPHEPTVARICRSSTAHQYGRGKATGAVTGPTAIGELLEPLRRRLVLHIIGKVEAGDIDQGTALLMLDVSGLTGDRQAFEDAVTGRDTAAGLADGRYQPADVDPGIRLPGDQARDFLVAQFDEQADAAIGVLATARVLTGASL